MTSVQERKIRQTGCDARFDNLTRQLYATDASIYQIEPVGVAFPKSAQQASAVIRAAADAGLSITPRGAGTSLVGNAIGEGLIVDFARHNRQITDLDLEKRSVRVGAGVVLDQLNEFLTPHGFSSAGERFRKQRTKIFQRGLESRALGSCAGEIVEFQFHENFRDLSRRFLLRKLSH